MTRPFITERLLMGRKESNQTNKQTSVSTNCLSLISKSEHLSCLNANTDCGNSILNFLVLLYNFSNSIT